MEKHKDGEHPFGDAGQIILFLLFIAIWTADSFFFRYTTFLAKYVHVYIRIAISVAVIAGVIKLIRSSHYIVSEEARTSRKMETEGVYSFVRHPMYMGVLLFYESLLVLTFSLAAFVFYLLVFIFYNYIASYEEKILEEEFGEEYLEYKKNTGRWMPR